jgi:hypothetical protein
VIHAFGRGLGLLGWVAAAALAFGCQSIVGIEDKKIETIEPCDETYQACNEYCTVVTANCTGTNDVYRTDEACQGLCNSLPLGDIDEPADTNTIACRLEHAILAGESEATLNCGAAGPGGGNLCGSDCESYCYLFDQICGSPFDTNEECLDKCRAFRDEPTFDVNAYYDVDSVECRLIHLANASNDESHCGHAAFQSNDHCYPPKDAEPVCEDMCRVAMVACQGEDSVYDDTATCLATCGALPKGTNTDTEQNTVGCRHYHSYNSILGPATHCSHAAPGGAGHCGEIDEGLGNCESYCWLAETACPTAFAAVFPGGEEECIPACQEFPGVTNNPDTIDVNETEQYSVALGEERNPAFVWQCRILHVSRALVRGTNDAVECDAALRPTVCGG